MHTERFIMTLFLYYFKSNTYEVKQFDWFVLGSLGGHLQLSVRSCE